MPNHAITDGRIEMLTREINHLRASSSHADDKQHDLLLKITEIQLNLAIQDKTLGKLQASIHGNGKPGLMARMDRVEHITGGLIKTVWLLTAAAMTAVLKLLFSRFG